MKERHNVFSSKNPTIFNDAKVLILGSVPGEDTLKQRALLNNDEYYSDKRNKFWEIIGNKYNCKDLKNKDYEYKKIFLKEHGIALWDILSYCTREGSGDATIQSQEYNNDIAGCINQHKSIRKIILNGKGKKIEWFNNYLKKNKVTISIPVISLVSTSGSHWDQQPPESREEWYNQLPD